MKQVKKSESEVYQMLETQVRDSWCFLFTGHWLQGRFKEDRKDISGLIHTFLHTFKNKKKRPALILKTSGAGFSYTERDQILDKIRQIQEMVREEINFQGKLPNIYLINGDLTDGEMNELYNHPKVKSMVSFTKGEGWGLPLLEFSVTGKPVICSNYSGPTDFLNPEFSILLPGKLKNIDPSAANDWLPKEGQWFQVSYDYAGQVLVDVFEKYEKYLEKSRKSTMFVKNNFSLDKMTEKFINYLEFNSAPTQVQIKLPPLKKIT